MSTKNKKCWIVDEAGNVFGIVYMPPGALPFPEKQGEAAPCAAPSVSIEGRKIPPSSNPKGTKLPDDFFPDDEDLAWARKLPVPGGYRSALTEGDLGREHNKFLDWHQSKGTVSEDWRATWRLWIRRAVEGPNRPKRGPGV
jgi:hypothetical protein